MSQSILVSLLISVLILAMFTLVSQEYRSTMQHTGERPVIAASTVTTGSDAPLHESTVEEIGHIR